ncbi:hypothetical protein RMATCC62417_12035 [Rhizopus microsporus]|nr:hypothetical protein RMATCC62417_12035 [Rhizopus microsporus]
MKHFATAFFICLVFITLIQARPTDGVTTNEVSGKGHSHNFKHTKTTVYTVGSDDGTTMEFTDADVANFPELERVVTESNQVYQSDSI